jgi:hypothetical protein
MSIIMIHKYPGDNRAMTPYSKLAPYYTHSLTSKFQEVYVPEKGLTTTDEAICAF